ncbi:DUF3328 domain containing protein [Pyrenophora teres f. maculata]|nr:DUF3328 domain containing protein [Pyrenophora teres f. maculata]
MSSNPAANNENNEAFIKKQKAPWWEFDRPWLALLSLFMTFISGSMIGVTYAFVVHRYTCQTVNDGWLGTFEHGFITEEVFPSMIFEFYQRRFDGNVTFLENATEILHLDPQTPLYVGPPSPEIDHNWEVITETRYWSISEDEAKRLWGVGRAQYQDHIKGGYTGGFDVFHTLHCLDMLRKQLNPEYYPEHHYGGVEHNSHCIEQIRQTLQCTATGTITPARYSPVLDYLYVDSAQVHTCRKFENLLEYTRSRYNGSLAVPRRQWDFK